jgi:hypothetical protein
MSSSTPSPLIVFGQLFNDDFEDETPMMSEHEPGAAEWRT